MLLFNYYLYIYFCNLCSMQLLPRPKIVFNSWSSWVYLSSKYMKYSCFFLLLWLSLARSILIFVYHPPLIVCFRLQGTLRHCAPSLWGRGPCTQCHQRTWTHCHLEAVFSFANWMPRGAGGTRVICLSNNILRLSYCNADFKHVWNGLIHRSKLHPQIFVF